MQVLTLPVETNPDMTVTTALAADNASGIQDIQPPLGQILLARGLIGDADLAKSLSFQATFGGILGGVMVRIGAVSEDAVLEGLSTQLGLDIMANERMPQDPATYVAALQAS